MSGVILRQYGGSATINFQLVKPDGVDFEPGATFAAGDVKIMKDEGAEGNTTNLPTDEGQGYSLVLTATEMQAARIVIYVVDQTATKVWLDMAIGIETYGYTNAQHAFDLDAAAWTAGQVADAVLDEVMSGHVASGSLAAELHLAKAMLANRRVHTVSTGVDQVMDDDGTTVLRTMTPTDGGSDTIDVNPS